MSSITYVAESNLIVRLAHVVRWSALRRIGALPMMRAVMFAPIVAYLILFNDYVIDFLTQVSVNIGFSPAEEISLTNVYFLYYGLISVGVASIVYGLSCPSSVARHADGMSFAHGTQGLSARTVAVSYFNNILGKFIQNHEAGDEKESADYPEELRLLTSRIVVEVYKEYLAQNPTDDASELEILGGFRTGSGYFSAEAIAECVYDAPRVTWQFSERYRSIAGNNFVADIALAKYELDDYSRPFFRYMTALLYIVGFVLLFIPSISTFMNISLVLFQAK